MNLLDQLHEHEADEREARKAAYAEYEELLRRATEPEPDDLARLLCIAAEYGINRFEMKTDIARALVVAEQARVKELAASVGIVAESADAWWRMGAAARAVTHDPASDEGQQYRRDFLRARGWRPAGGAWRAGRGEAVSATEALLAELATDVAGVEAGMQSEKGK